jgi:Flp pilus assembly pilin Flp
MIDPKPTRHPSRFTSKKGQTLVEYALIIAIVSVVAISALVALSGQAQADYTTVNVQLNDAQNGGQSAPSHH